LGIKVRFEGIDLVVAIIGVPLGTMLVLLVSWRVGLVLVSWVVAAVVVMGGVCSVAAFVVPGIGFRV